MLLVPCPHCGPRPEVEFRYAGEAGLARPVPSATDDDWTAYLYERRNPRGQHTERWRHIGCGRFFSAVRDTVSDRFIESRPIGPAGDTAGSRAKPR